MNIDEEKVVKYFLDKNLQAKEFSKDERCQSKTPDFRIFKNDKQVFFCEVKTISEDDFLEKQLKLAPPGAIIGGTRNDPNYNRLSNKIHEASQQFDAVNSNCEFPNILFFINHDEDCSYRDLQSVITGDFIAEGNRRYPIFRNYSEGRIKDEKFRIHLYVWENVFNDENHFIYNPLNKEHLNTVCCYFNISTRR